jgi:hypothetical protein
MATIVMANSSSNMSTAKKTKSFNHCATRKLAAAEDGGNWPDQSRYSSRTRGKKKVWPPPLPAVERDIRDDSQPCHIRVFRPFTW